MARASTKNDYITIAPVTPKGKWTICMRRVGSEDRYAPVAIANSQFAADSIVDALNLMQGEVKKLEVPAQRELERVRADLKAANEQSLKFKNESSQHYHKLREVERERDRITDERNIAQARLKVLDENYTRVLTAYREYRERNPEPKLVQSA